MPERLSFEHWRGDLQGGIAAAAVALPLALAFGVTSGAGANAGLYSAICVGFFAALFGGTPTQVAGPTGLLTIVAATIFAEYADQPAAAFTVIMFGGAFQILFGALKLGRYINLLPYPVMSGLTTGIGCILIIMQLNPLFGHAPEQHTVNALTAMPDSLHSPVSGAIVLGALSFAICQLVPARVDRVVSAPLIALVVGTLLGLLILTDAPLLGEFGSGLPAVQMPSIDIARLQDMIVSGLALALIGSLESLLTSMAAENATRSYHDPEQELVGQGIGNLAAGALGGMPGAGATIRTMANIRHGGRTRLSGMMHSLLLLGCALGLGGVIAKIPSAVLAGILIKVGADVIDWGYLRRIRRAPKTGVIFMFIVLGLTVFVSVITAVIVGMVLASLLFVKRMADLQLESIKTVSADSELEVLTPAEAEAFAQSEGRTLILRLAGPMSFGAANGLMRRLGPRHEFDVLLLDMVDVPAIDSSATLALEHIIQRAQRQKETVIVVGLNLSVAKMLGRLGVLDLIRDVDRLPTRQEGLEHAAEIIAELKTAEASS